MIRKEKPIILHQTLTELDYIAAEAALSYYSSPMKRRSTRVAMCLTGAVVAASLIPAGLRAFPRFVWIPIAVAAACAVAAILVGLLQPVFRARQVRKWFRSCPLAALPADLAVFHDHAEVKSSCEQITEYWTDFFLCVETDDLIAAAGGRERFLFVVRKKDLPKDTAKSLSALFHGAFDGRWYHTRRGGT